MAPEEFNYVEYYRRGVDSISEPVGTTTAHERPGELLVGSESSCFGYIIREHE